jgi:glycosyltransferase involved in cell wall biosynthesis
MKLTIITVVYNNQKTIECAIQSVLNQSFKNVEYIIIDGNSTDRTIEVVNSYRPNISCFISEPDKGLYYAMNKGIKLASGDIIGILNSDDLYADNDVLKDVIEIFEKDIDLDILYGDLMYVKRDCTTKIIRKWISKQYNSVFFERGNVPPHPTLFLKSKVYKEAGLFNVSYKLAADYEFMLRVFKKHKFKIIYFKRLMILMRLGGTTNNNFKNIFNGNIEILHAWRENNLKIPLFLMPLRIIKRVLQFF